MLNITLRQVQYTIKMGHTSPKKNKGRSPKLTDVQVDELEEYVRMSRETRRMSYLELSSKFPDWNVGELAIKNALERRGYSRCIARQKPPISERNRAIRRSWAEAHLLWSEEDWSRILWSDETYINDSSTRKYVTRMVGLAIFIKKNFYTNA